MQYYSSADNRVCDEMVYEVSQEGPYRPRHTAAGNLRFSGWQVGGRLFRTTIYTTNAVEAVHRQFRKLTKTKGGFANENSLLKFLYAGILKASECCTRPIQNWDLTLSQLIIHFPSRLEKYISL